MRRLLALAFVAMALVNGPGAMAQDSRPPKLEPLPEPPPPPAMSGPDEPRVQIPVQEGDKVEEVRAGGRVIALQVTPPNGKPYFLVESATGWVRRDSLDDGVRFPMWPIYTFD